jgi:hypothetical protein
MSAWYGAALHRIRTSDGSSRARSSRSGPSYLRAVDGLICLERHAATLVGEAAAEGRDRVSYPWLGGFVGRRAGLRGCPRAFSIRLGTGLGGTRTRRIRTADFIVDIPLELLYAVREVSVLATI